MWQKKEKSYISINDNEHFLVSLKKLLSILVSIAFCIFETFKDAAAWARYSITEGWQPCSIRVPAVVSLGKTRHSHCLVWLSVNVRWWLEGQNGNQVSVCLSKRAAVATPAVCHHQWEWITVSLLLLPVEHWSWGVRTFTIDRITN